MSVSLGVSRSSSKWEVCFFSECINCVDAASDCYRMHSIFSSIVVAIQVYPEESWESPMDNS